MTDDARAGAGDLRGKLAHATTARAVSAERAQGLEAQIARQADRYQATIKSQADRIRTLENENAELRLENNFYANGGAGPPETTAAVCVVDLCLNPAQANGHCVEHAWIPNGG